MPLVFEFLLSLLHLLHSIVNLFHRLPSLLKQHQPKPLTAPRRQLPDHLALVLVTRHDDRRKDLVIGREEVDAAIECARRVIGWCQAVGIEILTIYDSEGILKSHQSSLSTVLDSSSSTPDSLFINAAATCTTSRSSSPFDKSSSVFPLTPPASDHSSAASNAGDHDTDSGVVTIFVSTKEKEQTRRDLRKRTGDGTGSLRETLQLNLVSYSDGKPGLARIARTLASSHNTCLDSPKISVQEVNDVLESELSSPSLLIVHQLHSTSSPKPLELYAFPPWQLRLTEIYYTPAISPLSLSFKSIFRRNHSHKSFLNLIDERTFRNALDEFDKAEMREGK